MEQKNLRMSNDKNPAMKVERYKEPAPSIRFLTMKQIEEQLDALADQLKFQVMVATLIYAGLRREELLWLSRRRAAARGGCADEQTGSSLVRFLTFTYLPPAEGMTRQGDFFLERPDSGGSKQSVSYRAHYDHFVGQCRR